MKKAAVAIPNQQLVTERLQRHWSQQEVADKVGTTAVNVSRWERGLSSPGPRFRYQLCALFEKSAEALGLASNVRAESSIISHGTQQQPASFSPINAPLPWNIPYRRNLFFTGRENVLAQLHTALHTSKTAGLTQACALSGLGGIGKTQTALEYAYRYRDDYSGVLWARAETRDLLLADFINLASMLGITKLEGQAHEAVKQWLQSHTQWLLILDNVEDLTLLDAFLPCERPGYVLLTTRSQTTGKWATCITLEQMPPDEGTLFLLRRAKLLDLENPLEDAPQTIREGAAAVCCMLGGLPLALDQAGAYIEETGCSLTGYHDRFKQRQALLLGRRGGACADHPQSVAVTESLAFERIERTDATAAELLRFCAFLHPDAIPEELFTEGLTEGGAMTLDPFILDSAVAALRTNSLLRRNSDTQTLSMHRLVQVVLRTNMDEDTQRHWAERVVRAVNRFFPDVRELTNWPKCQRYLPQALACVTLIEDGQIKIPEAGHLLYQIGVYLMERAQYELARPLLEKARDLHEQVMGCEHPELATVLRALAALSHFQRRFVEAEQHYLRALTIREQTLGPQHPDVAVVLGNLAALYQGQRKYTQAQPLWKRALAILEQEPRLENVEVAQILNNLAYYNERDGEYAQAESLYQQSLAMYERVLGPAHPYVAMGLHSLGSFYKTQRKYALAEPLLHRGLAVWEQAMGSEDPDLAIGLNALAELYLEQGRYEEAEEYARRAFVIQERAFRPVLPRMAEILFTLARLHLKQGYSARAESYFQQALTIREQLIGSDHPNVAEVCYHLADCYVAQKKFELADLYYQQALTIWEKTLGADHLCVATCLESYAKLLDQRQQGEQAMVYLTRAMQIRRKSGS